MQFEEVLSQPDPKKDLPKLVDHRIGDNYPIDSMFKVIPWPYYNIKCRAGGLVNQMLSYWELTIYLP